MTRMTAEEFRDFCKRHNLRRCDAAWLCGGMTAEAALKWAKWGVPPAPSLIFKAIDQGLLPYHWFKENIDEVIPE